jgi:polynucleotide 5'-kinase involved in rRNA processing
MRTTVTIDEDVARLLRQAMHRGRQSFKETLNRALRRGLTQPDLPTTPPPRFVVKARPMGLKPGIDPTSLNKLAADLEDAEFIRKIERDSGP